MLKLAHKRPKADKHEARGLGGIPSHVFGLLRAQVLSGPVFTACLCLSVELGLVTDVDARQSPVSAKGF